MDALKQALVEKDNSVNLFKKNLALFDCILDQTTDGWWDINVETGECHISKKMLRFLGYPEDVEFKELEFFKENILPKDYAVIEYNLKQHLSSKGEFPLKQEIRMRKQNGEYVPG